MAKDRKGRDEGMKRAAEHVDKVDPAWRHLARAAVVKLAWECDDEFTVDDVWLILDSWHLERPVSQQALGPVMKRLRRDGIIVKLDKTKDSEQEGHHCTAVRVWRSNIRSGQGRLFTEGSI